MSHILWRGGRGFDYHVAYWSCHEEEEDCRMRKNKIDIAVNSHFDRLVKNWTIDKLIRKVVLSRDPDIDDDLSYFVHTITETESLHVPEVSIQYE
jgi:hypothetical protein